MVYANAASFLKILVKMCTFFWLKKLVNEKIIGIFLLFKILFFVSLVNVVLLSVYSNNV